MPHLRYLTVSIDVRQTQTGTEPAPVPLPISPVFVLDHEGDCAAAVRCPDIANEEQRCVMKCCIQSRLLLHAIGMMAVLLSGCATTRQPFTDGTIMAERKAFVSCA